jgi:hypothetical protein
MLQITKVSSNTSIDFHPGDDALLTINNMREDIVIMVVNLSKGQGVRDDFTHAPCKLKLISLRCCIESLRM